MRSINAAVMTLLLVGLGATQADGVPLDVFASGEARCPSYHRACVF